MSKFLVCLTLALCIYPAFAQSEGRKTTGAGHYLFAWAGDAEGKSNDFLAVIDADPNSPNYGRLVTTLATDQQTMLVHHTEYTMPASGMLFANDHYAGRTFIFDVRDPLHPKVSKSFTEMDGYTHPHSFLRLPNGHVLASFQHAHHHGTGGDMATTGGLVEIDDAGKVIRSASSADSGFPDALLTPYSLVVLPELDRVLSTNSSMHIDSILHGATYQLWRLSDLKLLKTAYVDVGTNHYSHIGPQEPRLGPDGAVYIETLACGLERITGLATDEPRAELVHTFPGAWCGVPTIVGHYLIEGSLAVHGLVVLDIADGAKPVEVCRLALGDTYTAHWTAWDPVTERVVVTSSKKPEDRLYLLKFDSKRGVLSLDESFRDMDGKVGFSFSDKQWPHGWKGSALPHGTVFSR
jgi:56kDa selenium binding protein (SBP56)